MKQHSPAWKFSRPAAMLAALLLAVAAGWCVAAAGDGWVAQFLRSRLTILAGALLLGCAAAAYLVIGTLWRLGRGSGGRGGPNAGTATVEMALVFPWAMMIVLIMVQSMLVVSGNLAVHYSAFMAARSAIVQAPIKIPYDEMRNVVGPVKLNRIKEAAVLALVPVSAGTSKAVSGAGLPPVYVEGMEKFFQDSNVPPPGWVRNMLSAKLQYALEFTEVTLDPPLTAPAYGDHEDLRVQVRHVLYLAVPYVNRIFGEPLPNGTGQYGTLTQASYALSNQGVEDEIDEEQFPRRVNLGS